MNAEKHFKDKVTDVVKQIEKVFHDNETNLNVGLNALMHSFVVACLHAKAEKSLMLKMFNSFWDDLEEKFKNSQK